jgi:2,3,4,5-tetrahydropyridine-2-carboxylate N-succinyltransferase
VAEKRDGAWVTHQWIKKAVLLYFRTHDNELHARRGGGASTRS